MASVSTDKTRGMQSMRPGNKRKKNTYMRITPRATVAVRREWLTAASPYSS